MAACAGCGRQIRSRRAGGIRGKGRTYHLKCAPEDLLAGAAEEWNAVFERGVAYFVRKYSAHSVPLSGDEVVRVRHFADLGREILSESKRRSR